LRTSARGVSLLAVAPVVRRKGLWIGSILVVAWESYWLREYLTAPTPDYHMQGPAALLFGAAIPLFLLLWILAMWLIAWAVRHWRA